MSTQGNGCCVGALNAAAILIEVDGAACIAEGAGSKEGFGHIGEDVCRGCLRWKVWKWELGCVGGCHELLVSHLD